MTPSATAEYDRMIAKECDCCLARYRGFLWLTEGEPPAPTATATAKRAPNPYKDPTRYAVR